ncbi:MAG: ComEC/Rec2 family competence protein [Verrucomicrobia bacterium]|nr:ComEC/Rec2 family competence protein [Verrucomicrobiota bacterium]
MKRPLLNVALLYVGGVLLGEHLAVPPGWALPALWAIVLGALFLNRLRTAFLVAALIGAGVVNLALHRAVPAADDLRRLLGDTSAAVTVRGVLEGNLSTRVYEGADGDPFVRTLARVRVRALKVSGGPWQRAGGRVAVSTAGVWGRPLWDGQAVEIEGVLGPPPGAAAPGLFDYGAYLRNQRVHYVLRVETPGDWRLRAAPARPSVAARFGEWARGALALGLPVEDEPLRLSWAMTLGWRTTLKGDVAEPFMRSGTLHVFAVSGLHVALLSTVFVVGLRVCRVPRAACGLVVIPLLWFYSAVTGWAASAVRSTVMMTVIIAGWSLRRPSDLLNSLAAAALLILGVDPLQLFQAGFQLSFAVVLSLGLVEPRLRAWSRDWGRPEPLRPPSLRTRTRRWLESGWRWVRASLVTSLAAWLGSMPLVAHYFHLVTPVSLLANLLIVPLSSWALTSAVASLLVAAWWPAPAVLFNHSAWAFMTAMIWLSRLAADLPGAWFYVRAPTLLATLGFYAAVLSLAAGWLTRPRWRGWTWAALGVLGLAWAIETSAHARNTRLTLLPLGGGHALYWDAPGRRHDVLVDCGDASSVRRLVVPFLRSQGVHRLPALVLTHGDAQHVGGAGALDAACPVERLWVGPARFRSPHYRKWLETFGQRHGRLRAVQAGDTFGPWTVLHPAAADRFAQADDASLVLAATSGPTRVLLLADLGKPGQAALMARCPDLRADLVVSGLPAKTEPLDNTLLQRLQPQAVIVADAPQPATARASRAVQSRLKARHPPALFTRETGAVSVEMNTRGWRLSAMHGERRARAAPDRQDTGTRARSATAPAAR